MAIKIKFRRGNASDWSSANPVLDVGEPGFEIDTGKIKVGDGTNHWNDLPYATGGSGATQLSELNDVSDTLSPANGQVLQYNGTEWISANIAQELNDLTDVNLSSPSNNQVLLYNGSDWVNSDNRPILNIQTLNSNTTLTIEGVYLCDTNSGGFTITLPSSGSTDLKNTITIRNIGSNNNDVTIQCQGTDTIEGSSSKTVEDDVAYTLVDNGSGTFYII